MKLAQIAKKIKTPLVPGNIHSLYQKSKSINGKFIAGFGTTIDVFTTFGAPYHCIKSLTDGELGRAAMYGLAYACIREFAYYMAKPKKNTKDVMLDLTLTRLDLSKKI